MLRLAISPDGDVLPDALARAPGRGAWIGVSRAELEAAIASGKLRGALARAFKGAKLTVPENLGALAQDALTRAFLQRLGLEMRAGKLILGSDRIAQQARSGAVAWLGHAADASDDGCRKLDQAYRVGMDAEGSGLVGERLPLDRAALSVALGRENVVHLALADHGSAERVAIPLRRLMRFTGAYPAAENISPEGATNGAAHDAVTVG
ncbi:MAG: nucleic-acid-binding protein [Sphingomonadales bacterium 63-6]|nr:MAG: nucleic-acid-binding protein [Sphingomonadales bacterium 63-6]